MHVPNLFIVGAPKCGTTSLAYWLGQHPDVFAPREKEPGFFGSDLQGSGERPSLACYTEHYSDWSDEMFALDATPSSLVSHSAAREIARMRPDAHIIVAVRNPVEAVHSAFHHSRFRLTETLDTLEEALDAEAERKTRGEAPKFGLLQSLLYTEIFSYKANIKRFADQFPPEQIHIVLTEDMRDRPQSLMSDLFGSLGLARDFVTDLDLGSKNEAGAGVFKFLTRLSLHPPKWVGIFSKRLVSLERRVALRAAIRSLNTRKATNPPLEPGTRARLEAIFANDIAWLEDYLQRDLSHWKSA